MEVGNMFEFATRNKLRFPYKGQVSVEDLWDIPVQGLDSVFKTLNAQVKQAKEESLLEKKSDADQVIEIQIEIIKHIVAVKQAEAVAQLQAKKNAAEKQKLLAILANKKDEELMGKSAADIQAMIDALS